MTETVKALLKRIDELEKEKKQLEGRNNELLWSKQDLGLEIGRLKQKVKKANEEIDDLNNRILDLETCK